jgi:hypothetical protein
MGIGLLKKKSFLTVAGRYESRNWKGNDKSIQSGTINKISCKKDITKRNTEKSLKTEIDDRVQQIILACLILTE